jgi:hypothetical protein
MTCLRARWKVSLQIHMPKLKLNFMVDPEQLKSHAEVPDAIRIRITNTQSPLVRKYLGESGLRMADHDFSFFFTRRIAEELLGANVAQRD